MNHAIDTSAVQHDVRAAVARQVEAFLAQLHPTVTLERRRDERLAVPVLFQLTPLDENRQPITSAAFTVVGKNISRRGLSFYHDQPLPYRRAVISAQHPECDGFSAEIDVSWCRFTKPGWYESGGRLLAVTSAKPLSVGKGDSN